MTEKVVIQFNFLDYHATIHTEPSDITDRDMWVGLDTETPTWEFYNDDLLIFPRVR